MASIEGVCKLKLDVQPINLDVDTIVPIGLITNELVTNSLKYAFPDERTGTITVTLKEVENQLNLSVADDGIGMDSEKYNNPGDSFGYKLVTALIGQLKGEMKVLGSKGTTVEIVIKKYEKAFV